MLRTTHQLKAPFAAIHANTQLLLGGYCGPLPAAAATVIEQIAARCEMLSRGIKAMLQLANLRSSGPGSAPAGPVDLPALIRLVPGRLEAPGGETGHRCSTRILSPATVRAVPDHARHDHRQHPLQRDQLFAGRAAGRGVVPRREPDGGAMVVVRDSGIGIPPDKLPRIFDDYFRTTEGGPAQPCVDRAGTGHRAAERRWRARSACAWKAPRRGHGLFPDFPIRRTCPEKLN